MIVILLRPGPFEELPMRRCEAEKADRPHRRVSFAEYVCVACIDAAAKATA